MTSEEAVAALDALPGDNGYYEHEAAEQILREAVPEAVRDAFDRLVDRNDWWDFG